MDPIDLLFRGVGLFYLAASYFALRAILMDSVLDKAIAAISLSGEDPKERLRRQIVGTATVAFGAGGAALLLLSTLALPLFLANLAAQGIWLAGARRIVIPAEDDDAQSVRQLVMSTLLYAAATLGVVWLWRAGRLGPWDDPLAAALVAAAAAGLGLYFVYHMAWKPASPGSPDWLGTGDENEPGTPPRRIVIDPARWCWPLIDAETQERFNHMSWLDDELAWRVEHWDDVFQNAFDVEDDLAALVFASQEEEAGYRAEAAAIAEALKAVYGSENVSFGHRWSGTSAPDA